MTGREETMRGSRVGLPFAVLLAALSWLLAGVMLWAGAAPALDHHAAERNPRHSHLFLGPPAAAELSVGHPHAFGLPHRHDLGFPADPLFGLPPESPPGLVVITGAPEIETAAAVALDGVGSVETRLFRSIPALQSVRAVAGIAPATGTFVPAPTPPPETGLA